jgi:branched-subunit amino acid ABC-type transport system permease component
MIELADVSRTVRSGAGALTILHPTSFVVPRGRIERFTGDKDSGLGWHAPGSDWSQSIIFGILILILVFRPEGLLGERTPEGA